MSIRHTITLTEAAKALRLRRPVVRRLVERRLLKGQIVRRGQYVRVLIDRDDLARVRRAQPWRACATRSFGW